MKTPYELAYRYVIPHIQRKLVLALREKGLTNTEIARKLGITPSAVTRYLKGERGTAVDLSRFGDIEEMIGVLAEKIAKGAAGTYEVLAATTAVAAYALSRKYLCSYHALIDEGVDPRRCGVCPQVLSPAASLAQELLK